MASYHLELYDLFGPMDEYEILVALELVASSRATQIFSASAAIFP